MGFMDLRFSKGNKIYGYQMKEHMKSGIYFSDENENRLSDSEIGDYDVYEYTGDMSEMPDGDQYQVKVIKKLR